MNIAIIPARGGSKRVPLKNIRDFYGVPMIIRTIRVLKSSACFDEIIVSTESEIVANCVENEDGVKISWRDPALAIDSVNTVDVIAETLAKFEIHREANVCCVYAPNPFLHEGALEIGLRALDMNPRSDYVSSVTTYPFPIQRCLEINQDSELLEMSEPKYLLTHSQNLEPRFHETAQFWWAKSTTWLDRKPMQLNLRGIYVPRWMSQDIDTLEDWKQAEIRWKILEETNELKDYRFSEVNIIGRKSALE